jgi:hypothetical protein
MYLKQFSENISKKGIYYAPLTISLLNFTLFSFFFIALVTDVDVPTAEPSSSVLVE